MSLTWTAAILAAGQLMDEDVVKETHYELQPRESADLPLITYASVTAMSTT